MDTYTVVLQDLVDLLSKDRTFHALKSNYGISLTTVPERAQPVSKGYSTLPRFLYPAGRI